MANLKLISEGKPPVELAPPGRQLGNWLAGYAEYTAANEAPECFHLWVGLGTIAGAAQRKVQLINPYFEVHSNLYVVLVAPPGTARKTTALKIGQRLLKKVPAIHFTTKAGSAAALVQQFANLPSKEHQSLTAYALEFGSFMGSSNATDMVDFVTDIYDGNPDWDKQTILRGMEKIPHPWFNMMGATTPRWLGDHLPPTAVEGGFVARTIWVYYDRRKLSSPFPKETPRMRELRDQLINDLTHISTLSGEFSFDPDAEKFYSDWYLDESRFPEMPDERTGGYFERKHIHVLKLAVLLSLAEKDELVITVKDLKAALALLEATEPGMVRAFSAVGKNTYSTDLDRIKAQIRSNPHGVSRAAILNKNIHALNRQQIEEVLSVLMQMGEIDLTPGNIFKPR